jgi:ATP-dependent Clp protease protease subunit
VSLLGSIEEASAEKVIARLLELEDADPDAPITLLIDSDGGFVYPSLAIYDSMQFVGPEVHTRCVGKARGLASLLLAAGARGKRTARRHARIEVGRITSNAEVQPIDELDDVRTRIAGIYADHTGWSVSRLIGEMHVGLEMTAKEALVYGIIDRVEE